MPLPGQTLNSRVRQAKASDLEAVRRLNALLRTGVRDFYWDSDRYLRSAIARRSCYVAREDGEVQAALIVANQQPQGARQHEHLVIETLVVDPRFRGRGIGTELVELAKRLAFEGDRRLYVESFYEYGKPSYYRKIGFELDDPAQYRGRPYHVLHFDPRPIPAFPIMKRIAIADRLHYLRHLRKARVVTGDLTFERLLLRDDPSRKVRLSLLNGNAIAAEVTEGGYLFYPPVGSSRIDATVLQCLEWLADRRTSGRFTRVPLELVSILSPRTRSRLRTTREGGNREWRYAVPGLCDATGAATRTGERSLLASFLNRAPVLKWEAAGLRKELASRCDPRVDRALAQSASLGLLTAGLYADGTLSGFAVAGIERRTAFVHFQEASRERGARQALLHLFAAELRRRGTQIVNYGKQIGTRYPASVIEKRSLELRAAMR